MNKEAILEEIVEISSLPQLQKSDITRQDYAQATGISARAAANRLDKLVDEGILETVRVFDPETRRHRRVWRKT